MLAAPAIASAGVWYGGSSSLTGGWIAWKGCSVASESPAQEYKADNDFDGSAKLIDKGDEVDVNFVGAGTTIYFFRTKKACLALGKKLSDPAEEDKKIDKNYN